MLSLLVIDQETSFPYNCCIIVVMEDGSEQQAQLPGGGLCDECLDTAQTIAPWLSPDFESAISESQTLQKKVCAACERKYGRSVSQEPFGDSDVRRGLQDHHSLELVLDGYTSESFASSHKGVTPEQLNLKSSKESCHLLGEQDVFWLPRADGVLWQKRIGASSFRRFSENMMRLQLYDAQASDTFPNVSLPGGVMDDRSAVLGNLQMTHAQIQNEVREIAQMRAPGSTQPLSLFPCAGAGSPVSALQCRRHRCRIRGLRFLLPRSRACLVLSGSRPPWSSCRMFHRLRQSRSRKRYHMLEVSRRQLAMT